MQRVPEPEELMEDAVQVAAYAAADFQESNSNFMKLFERHFGEAKISGCALDIGCGPGDICFRFARAYPNCQVHGLDGSEEMLAFARKTLQQQPPILRGRVRFIHGRIPEAALPRPRYDIILCNSLLHHLPDPAVLWQFIKKTAAENAPVLVMDLKRPPSEADARTLVNQYAENEPEILRRDFYNSFLAAFEPEEVRSQLRSAGLANLSVEEVSDRHLLVWGWI